MKIEVKTTEYEFSHGKKPRGYGNWAFWIGSDSRDISKAHFFLGNYGDAIKKAKAMARELGYTTVTMGA